MIKHKVASLNRILIQEEYLLKKTKKENKLVANEIK